MKDKAFSLGAVLAKGAARTADYLSKTSEKAAVKMSELSKRAKEEQIAAKAEDQDDFDLNDLTRVLKEKYATLKREVSEIPEELQEKARDIREQMSALTASINEKINERLASAKETLGETIEDVRSREDKINEELAVLVDETQRHFDERKGEVEEGLHELRNENIDKSAEDEDADAANRRL